MTPYQQRAAAELVELDARIKRLAAFLALSAEAGNTPDDIDLLHLQRDAMTLYREALQLRVARWRTAGT